MIFVIMICNIPNRLIIYKIVSLYSSKTNTSLIPILNISHFMSTDQYIGFSNETFNFFTTLWTD